MSFSFCSPVLFFFSGSALGEGGSTAANVTDHDRGCRPPLDTPRSPLSLSGRHCLSRGSRRVVFGSADWERGLLKLTGRLVFIEALQGSKDSMPDTLGHHTAPRVRCFPVSFMIFALARSSG